MTLLRSDALTAVKQTMQVSPSKTLPTPDSSQYSIHRKNIKSSLGMNIKLNFMRPWQVQEQLFFELGAFLWFYSSNHF